MSLWDIIVWPFARLLEILYNWTDSYGLAIILFALVVNLILLPFMAKSKKGMMKTTRIQPQLKELEKKHRGNQQKYQQEVMKLYKEQGASPTSGCLVADPVPHTHRTLQCHPSASRQHDGPGR